MGPLEARLSGLPVAAPGGAGPETLRALRLRIPSTDLRQGVWAAKRQLAAAAAAGKPPPTATPSAPVSPAAAVRSP